MTYILVLFMDKLSHIITSLVLSLMAGRAMLIQIVTSAIPVLRNGLKWSVGVESDWIIGMAVGYLGVEVLELSDGAKHLRN